MHWFMLVLRESVLYRQTILCHNVWPTTHDEFQHQEDFFWSLNYILCVCRFRQVDHTLVYPSIDKVLEYADKQDSIESMDEKPMPTKAHIDHIKWVPLKLLKEQKLIYRQLV